MILTSSGIVFYGVHCKQDKVYSEAPNSLRVIKGELFSFG